MFRKLAAAFLLVMLLAPYVCHAAEDGLSWETAYVIDSYSEFRNIMRNGGSNSSYVTSGKYIKLSCDIQLAGISDWEPAGTLDTPFTGHFDGQGHTIYINIQPLPVTIGTYIKLTYDRSLFGVIASGSEIGSLDVEGTVRGYNAGGLVSILQGGTIKNCSFSGDVTADTSPAGDDAMSELIYELGDDNITDANGVEVVDNLSADPKTRVYGKINAGGLVAVMLGGNIEASSFRGKVTASADLTPASAGGIVGRMIEDSENISGCYVEGDAEIRASTSGNSYSVFAMAGGIAGYANTQLDSMIDSCRFGGYVFSSYYAGGIAGLVRGTILSGDTVTSTAVISGTYSAGGIAGYMASGGWAAGNNVESGAAVTAETYSAGGIIGLLETSGRPYENSRAVEYNNSDATVSGDVYKGGIVGALGNNTYSGLAVGDGNTYTGADYGIGRDEWGEASEGYVTYTITPTAFTAAAGELFSETLTLNRSLSAGASVTWSASGTPDGMTVSSSGAMSWTPAQEGEYSFTASADISDYGAVSADITLTVTSSGSSSQISIDIESLSSGTQDTAYSEYFSASGYSSFTSIVWELAGGTLPEGMTFGNSYESATSDERGLLAGTPTESGLFSFTVKVTVTTSSSTYSATKALKLYITPTRVVISNDEGLPDGTLRRAYSTEIEADFPAKWTLSSGTLPGGLSLTNTSDGTCIISGTPTESGEFSFTLTAVSGNLTGEKTFTLIINDADFTISADSLLKPGIRGQYYYPETLGISADSTVSTSSAVWYVYSGTLPPGLNLGRNSGTISGTPTAAGTYTFRIGLLIGDQITSKSFTIIIVPGTTPTDFSITNDSLKPGIVDEAYTQTLSTDADADSFVWYVDSGTLPAGLSLSRSTGEISGTPTASGTYTFTIGLLAGEQVVTKSFTIIIIPSGTVSSYSITTDSLIPGSTGTSYTQDITADAPTTLTPYVWYVDDGELPPGLTLSRTNGRISGTPTASGTYTFTIGLLAGEQIMTKSFTVTIVPGFSILTDSSLKPGIVGERYTLTLSTDASASDGTRTWYVNSGTLPGGLSLNRNTGTISGTPTAAGTSAFTVGLYAGDKMVTKSFTLLIVSYAETSDYTITNESMNPGIIGESYSQELSSDVPASLGTRTWYVDSGTLPAGLSLSRTTGTISGTPTTAGTYTFTVGLLAGNQILTKSFTIVIIPDYSITTDSLRPGIVGDEYEQVLSTDAPASLGTRTWYVDSGTLPAGLSLSRTTGTILGTPTTAGTYTFTIGLLADSRMYSKSFTLIVIPGAAASSYTITTDSVKPGIVGEEYSHDIDADAPENLSPYVWYVDSGTLPAGLSLSRSTGTISGTPTTAGTYEFTIGLLAGSQLLTKTFTLIVIPGTTASSYTITTDSLNPGIRGTNYGSLTLTTDAPASLGTQIWYMDSGSLPSGLKLSSSGVISGTPTASGTYSFTVGLLAGNQILTKTFTLVIIPGTTSSDFTITTESLRIGVRGTPYSVTLSSDVSASLTPRVWYIESGDFPSGLRLSRSAGTISGTPTSAGTYSFTIGLLAGGLTTTKSFTLTILPSLSISTDWLKPGIQGTPYSAVLSADAVTSAASCVWYIESGSLPNGLTLSRSTGTISGTPTSSGTYSFTVGLLADGLTASRTLSLLIISGTVSSDYSITTVSLTPGIVGSSYAQTLSSDIPASYTPRYWYINSGTLPEGLYLSRTAGIISGTPAESGTYTFTVGLLAGNQLLFKEFTLTVIPGTSITTESLPYGTEGKSYSQTLASDSSASGTRVWYIDTGELPPGLTLSRNTGVISGTPTKSGTYSFRVRLLIGDQITAKTFTLLIVPGLAISGDTLPEGKEGESYSYTFTASADSAVWTHTAGTLPPGLTLSTTGILSGTPTRAGTYSFTVRAVSSAEGLRAERTLTLTIRPVFSILTDAALTRAKVSTWYSVTLSADADSSYMVSWKLLDGTLPGGLYLNSSTGNISGTPQAEGTYSFTIQASAGSYIAAKRFTLIVGPALEILTEAQLPSWKLNKYYSLLFTTDSALPVNWSLTDGSIPAGLYFADGVLDGTPTAEGEYTFTLTAESGGMTSSKTFTMTIKPALSITTPEILPAVKAKAYYSYTLSSDADDPSTVLWSTTYSDVFDYNGLPEGMYIDETTGTIYGTPTTEGTYTFTIRAVMGSVSTSKEFTLTVRPMLSIETENPLPHAEINEKYSVTLLSDADEDAAVTWSVVDGTLPDRLTLDAQTGELSGYILNEGTYSFTIQAFSSGLIAQKRFELTAGVIMSIIVPESEPLLEAGEYFEMALLTDKTDAASTTWAVIDGILPPGIDLSTSTGVISGTPTRAGRYTITVKAESGYSVATKTITLTVDFMISSEWILPNGAVGESYSYRFTAKGVSTSAVLWTVSSDSVLPRGLTLATNGILSGTTNEAGKYTFMLYAFVSNDVSAMQTVRLTIDADPDSAVPVLTTSLPDGQVSQDYYAELRAGISGVTWQVESGELPEGLTLRADGLISGVPVRAGTYAFVVRVSASNRYSTRQFTITINAVPETRYASGGGGGGCDSGIGVIGLAVLGLMFRRRKH